MKTRTLIVLIFLTLSACVTPATPPGKLGKDDFVWKEKIINNNYHRVYRNITNGFRTCGGFHGHIFGTHVGVPDCFVYPDTKEALCDIYLADHVGETSSYVMGTILVKKVDENKTLVRIVTRKGWFSHREKVERIWLEFADGYYFCKETK